MNIEIDTKAGFCFGVDNSISQAEKEIAIGRKLYCLGEIVHNEIENERLRALGIEIIDMEQFQQLKDATVLLRAHGEPPSTYRIAKENNIELIDTTCAVVEQLQHKIFCSYEEVIEKGGQIVVYGKRNHPEVIGLVGQTNDEAITVESLEDLDAIDFNKPVQLFSQTTKSEVAFQKIEREIKTRIKENGANPDDTLVSKQTICKQVTKRAPYLESFATRFDVVIFVAGKNSSNGRVLSEVCKSVNENTFTVSSPDELQVEWFHQVKSIGITGATSTPLWLLEEIADQIRNFSNA